MFQVNYGKGWQEIDDKMATLMISDYYGQGQCDSILSKLRAGKPKMVDVREGMLKVADPVLSSPQENKKPTQVAGSVITRRIIS